MKHYLLIESEAALGAGAHCFALARDLARQGAKVELMLVQNGVMSARAGAHAPLLAAALDAGIAVWADEFALKERALTLGRLVRGVKPAPLGTIVDRLAAGAITIWH